MSFADSLREELCELPVKRPCCRGMLTAGLLLCAVAEKKPALAVRYRSEPVATLASAMIALQYGHAPESEMQGGCGHRYYDLSFASPAAYKLLTQVGGEGSDPEAVLRASCDGCRSAFLRGAFLSCGTLNDPHKSFHLEFLLPDSARADFLSAFLENLGYPPRRIARKHGIGLYFKESGSVEDLVALMGAQQLIFDIINTRIEREIRNNENRATNCVARNIEKTVAAGARQIEAIGALIADGRLERMPEGVQITAMLRYRNPDATLDELVALHEPPISKSGLNHRLKKILEEAESTPRKELS